MNERQPPVVNIIGASGSGKTTLIEHLIPEIASHRLRVGTIKHDVHEFSIDHPGKDSWRHKQAGATATMISSPKKIAMVKDVNHDHTPEELLPLFSGLDIVLTEGYKRIGKAKVEVFRPEILPKPLCMEDKHLIALVTDFPPLHVSVPVFKPDDCRGLADFLVRHFRLRPPSCAGGAERA